MKSEIELIISEKILENGIISFAEYMEIALFHKKYGYYNNQGIFGNQGDFVTSPITSSLYGASISNEFINISESIPNLNILEIGAGDGSLVISILKYLDEHMKLPSTYFIIESSNVLIDLQKKNIKKEIPSLEYLVKWVKEDEITNINGLVICNEFFDVLPTERFKISNNKILQLFISFSGKFEESWVDNTLKFREFFTQLNITDLISKYNHYESELNLNYESWVERIDKIINKGVVFIIDYGYNSEEYFLPDRSKGTLVCIHKHHPNFNPLENIGLQDISSFVNFSHLSDIFKKYSFNVSGYTEQSKFLINLGILEVFEKKGYEGEEKITEMNKLKNLILSNTMGNIFKALIISKNFQGSLLSTKDFNRMDVL